MTTRTEPHKVLVLTLALALAASLLVLVGPLTNKALSQTTPSGTLDANTLPPGDPLQVCDEAGFTTEPGNWGQTFTALNSGNVHSVQLSVRGFEQPGPDPWTPPIGDLSVRLTAVDASGRPDTNTTLATTTVPASEVGRFHSLVSANFTNPPSIEAGTQYALVLNSMEAGSTYTWEIQCPRGSYSGGMLMINIPVDGGFIPDARYGGGVTDAVFAICLNGPCPNGSEPPVFDFAGFFPPVDNLPTTNVVQAGRSIPLKFSLGGDQGLDIFAAGYPHSGTIPDDPVAPLDDIEETVTAGASSLSYDATSDQYIYVWKTDKAWSGQTRQLVLKLTDGSEHKANFQFR
jgi:hypothetical protein